MINLIKKLMPKKKAEKITVDLKAKNSTNTFNIPATTTESHDSVVVEAPLVIEPVKYSGLEVVEILNDGKETADHFHCKMSDGTTMHVPKSLFNV